LAAVWCRSSSFQLQAGIRSGADAGRVPCWPCRYQPAHCQNQFGTVFADACDAAIGNNANASASGAIRFMEEPPVVELAPAVIPAESAVCGTGSLPDPSAGRHPLSGPWAVRRCRPGPLRWAAVLPTSFSMRVAALATVAVVALSVGLASASGATPKPKPKSKRGVRTRIAAAPNDPLWPAEWGPRLVGMPAVWRLPVARRVVVAVLDSGVDADQPDLRGLVIGGWNAFDGSADTADDAGHGTLVAGVIAARADNKIGTAGYCHSCVIMPVKVLDAAGRGNSDTITAGIDWAVAHGADVINLSLVLAARDATVSAAVARALASGVVVVSSAGNASNGGPAYPAAEPGVIAVAGEDPTGALYAWSGAGEWVTTAAPGCNQSTALDGGFTEFCGTSSATAAASGIVGAALAQRSASPAEVRADVAAASTGPSREIDAAATAALVAAR
jgi:hypothetical protein